MGEKTRLEASSMTDNTSTEKTSNFLKSSTTENFKKHKEETISSRNHDASKTSKIREEVLNTKTDIYSKSSKRNQPKDDDEILFEKVVHKRKKSVKFDNNEKQKKVRGIAADFFTSSSNKRKSTGIIQKQSEKNKKKPKLELTFSRLIVNDIIHGIIDSIFGG